MSDDSLDAGQSSGASTGDSTCAEAAAARDGEQKPTELTRDALVLGGSPPPDERENLPQLVVERTPKKDISGLMENEIMTQLVAENNKLKVENHKLREENYRLMARRRASIATEAEIDFRMLLAEEAGIEFESPQEAWAYLKTLGDQLRVREYEAIKWERQISFHSPYHCADSAWPDGMRTDEIQHKPHEDQKRLCRHCVCISFDVTIGQGVLEDILGGLGLEVKTMTSGWLKVGCRPFCSVAFRRIRDAESLLVNKDIRTQLFASQELQVSCIWPLAPKSKDDPSGVTAQPHVDLEG